MRFRVQKIRDEGTADPYIARIWLGLIGLRDQVLQFASPDAESAKRQFDQSLQPVLDALDSAREANKTIQALVEKHREKVESGAAISFQPNAFAVNESIDTPLRAECERFLTAGVRAIKSVQPLLENFSQPIGCLFNKDSNFQKGLCDLEAAGHTTLAKYLQAVRLAWSDQFVSRRNSLEHKQWRLPPVDYKLAGTQVTLCEPIVDGVTITVYTDNMLKQILLFVEEMVAFGLAEQLPNPIILIEEPVEAWSREEGTRFRIHLAGGGMPKWELKYNPRGFH